MTDQVSPIEKIKIQSHGLRGTISEELEQEITGAISEQDQALIKFHGMYQQDDRDRRDERALKKLERLYSFMIRLRLPGGMLKPEQWLAVHDVAGRHSTGVIKITTRQTLQLHGILKSNIKPTVQSFCRAALDSIATCGDINRNVICAAHPMQSPLHATVHGYAKKISDMLMPQTRAYYEIWLDEEKLATGGEQEDPLYQDRYLPRKFKIALAIPPNNDVDVYANDVGLIAIIESGQLLGFNVLAGGGLSATHGNPATYPRLASVLGFVPGEEKILKTVYEIVTLQRDYGNRSDRKLARLKYTLDKYGVDWFRHELEKRTGFALLAARPFRFTERRDHYGWATNQDGRYYYTPFIENGRVLDEPQVPLKSALYDIASSGKANFRFTANQNLILADIAPGDKAFITDILDRYNVQAHTEMASALRKNSMACVALNTCPLALAEGQRYLPALITKIEVIMARHRLDKEDIILRMTGCPNGCARSTVAEIGFIGTAPGRYNLHLGGDHQGTRLNRLYREQLDETAILTILEELLGAFAINRRQGEYFGDFALRYGWV